MNSALHQLFRHAGTRRALTVPAVTLGSVVLTGTAAVWAPAAAVVDLLAADRRFPRVRLLSFAWAWTTLESIGVGASSALWLTGKADDRAAHYALQRWWAARLVDALGVFANLRIDVDGIDRLRPGPIVICAQHASIADALLPAWLLGRVQMQPRYVLKDDLLLDPSLDIVGNRLPNHFVDRAPDDNRTELDFLTALARGMSDRDAAVIFPEGTVVTPARRARAVQNVRARDAARGDRVGRLRVLAPARAGGTNALLAGAPEADLVIVTHAGLESLRQVRDAPAQIPLVDPLRVRVRRIPRAELPTGDEFPAWFDDQWEIADRELTTELGVPAAGHAADR